MVFKQRGRAAEYNVVFVGEEMRTESLSKQFLFLLSTPPKIHRADAGGASRLFLSTSPKPHFLFFSLDTKFLPLYPGELRGTRTQVFSQLLYRMKQRKLPKLELSLLT